MRLIESWDYTGFAFYRIPGQQDRPGTERDPWRFLSRSQLSRDFESRSQARNSRDLDPDIVLEQPPVPDWIWDKKLTGQAGLNLIFVGLLPVSG